jgi:hypothetical protein
MKWKYSCRANYKSFPSHPQTANPSWTLSSPTRATPSSKPIHRDTLPDIVRSSQTLFGSPRILSGVWIWAQWLDSWESPIYTHTPPMDFYSWPLHFSIKQAHILYSKRLNSLSPRASIRSSCLGIEWSNDSSSLCDSLPQAHLGCWIFILHAYYSWSLPPRWLEVALELPLGVVSLGRFVLPILW